jgi:hypothetical protein
LRYHRRWLDGGIVAGEFGKELPSGAKAPLILQAFLYGLKPVPFKTTNTSQSISEAKGPIVHDNLSAT